MTNRKYNRISKTLLVCCLLLAMMSKLICACVIPDCGDCETWNGSACVSDCASGEVCCNGTCQECCDDEDCAACEVCDGEGDCTCVVVTGISGISSTYYLGDSTTVTAALNASLPSGCSIEWGGDATFSNVSANTATATFNSIGTYKKITAKTSCQNAAVSSSNFAVVKINQFNADSKEFPKCINESISQNDFVIVTDPSGFEGDVSVSGLSTATVGTHTAQATLWGMPSPPVETDYVVVGSGDWIDIANIPHPSAGGINVSNSIVDYILPPSLSDPWTRRKTTLSIAGGYCWKGIGGFLVSWSAAPSTTVTVTKTLSAAVEAEGSVSIPFLTQGKISVTIGGSWESSKSHTISSGPGKSPCIYEYKHYQKRIGTQRTITVTEEVVGVSPPTSVTYPGITGTVTLDIWGSNDYMETIRKKCP